MYERSQCSSCSSIDVASNAQDAETSGAAQQLLARGVELVRGLHALGIGTALDWHRSWTGQQAEHASARAARLRQSADKPTLRSER